jgi:uncharacterized protein YciU (UPF0263 family)
VTEERSYEFEVDKYNLARFLKDSGLDDTVEKITVEDVFEVILDVIAKKDEAFQVYYTDQTSDKFNEEQSIWIETKGSDFQQKVSFKLPKDFYPKLIRVDFGLKDKQEDIVLNSIEIKHLDKSVFLEGIQIANYFRPLDKTEIDFNTGVIKAKFENGKRIEPVLFPHETVQEKLFDDLAK